MRLSQNFTEDEFACHCGSCPQSRDPMVDVGFIMTLQKMRNRYGRPIKISSGVRCVSHNQAVGGSPSSKHLIGIAADLVCSSASDRYWLLKYAMEAGFTGIGVGRDFLHVDSRDGAPVVWTY